MSDPITHTLNASPWIVAILSTAASCLFGLPLGVVITAAGGAYWAIYRGEKISTLKSILLIVIATTIAAVMVDGVSWFLTNVIGFAEKPPQRPLAFMLGFAVIDKQFRDKLFGLFTSKFEAVEVKKP